MSYRLFTTVFAILFIFLIVFAPGRKASVARVQADPELSSGQRAEQEADLELTSIGALEAAPAMFIENVGQFDERARFQVRGGDRTIWLAEDAIWVTILEPTESPTSEALRPQGPDIGPEAERLGAEDVARQGVAICLSFVGANSEPELQAYRPLTTTVSYFIGDEPDEWHPAVPVWGGVRYVDLYPGLDLELDGINGDEGLHLICRAANCGDALTAVQLEVEGADSLTLEGDRLHIKAAAGTYMLPLLQAVDAGGHPLHLEEGRATTRDNILSMPLSAGGQQPTERGNGLLTAPADVPSALLYSTFLGGSGGDSGSALAIDAAGNATVAGRTGSPDFPTTPGSYDTGYNYIFLAKINAAGSALLYSTFLGGSGSDGGNALALDSAGNAAIVGSTESTDFPTTPGAYDTIHNGDYDVFIAKLNDTGSTLLFSTFLGGSTHDSGYALALDMAGNAAITGSTQSVNFPTTPGAYDTSHNGDGMGTDSDVFVTKINAAGSELVYSTFLGGISYEIGRALTHDATGNATVTGYTFSTDFPTTPGVYDTDLNGSNDVFVTKLNTTGTDLIYSTFVGGDSSDSGQDLAFDTAGNATVTGHTSSTDFPTTPGAYDTSCGGNSDAFVVKLNADGSGLLYSTFLGGGSGDHGSALALDADGSAAITGGTTYTDFPTTPGALDTSYNGGLSDVFVAKLNAAGNDLLYSTFLGGGYLDSGSALALDSDGNATVTGVGGIGFPTTPGAFDRSYNGADYPGGDAFLASLNIRIGSYRIFIPVVMN